MILESKSLLLKNVEITDAKLILSLRTDCSLNKYLSKTNNSLEEQKEWLIKYKEKEKNKLEYYFKISDKKNNDIGFIRLYNIDSKNEVVTFGSFILKKDRPKYTAIESMVTIIYFAFKKLKMKKVILDVRVKNEHAKKLYNRFGFEKKFENGLDEFYELSLDKFEKLYKEKYYVFMEVQSES